jgi:glycine betaine/choline ABC-type transport system substrate-binding protein
MTREVVLMKRFLFILMTLSAVLFPASRPSDACVGKVLNIGISNSSGEQLFAEMLSLLINERTGTTVSIRVYRDSQEMYQAVKKGEVSILIENTNHALELLGRPPEENARKAYVISKEEFRKSFNLVWLEPIGLLHIGSGKAPAYYVPIITVDAMNNFPALPRVINKLSGTVSDEVFEKFMKAVNAGQKSRITVKDFLRSRKLI